MEIHSIIKQLLNKSKEFIKFVVYFKLGFPSDTLGSLLFYLIISD